MKYMLDTNTCIYLMKNVPAVVEQYRANKHMGICISATVLAELYFGVYNSSNVAKNGANLTNFLLGLDILDFCGSAAIEYGIIRAVLQKRGLRIGSMDLLIAAHAKAAGLVLVTNNTREFLRVGGLQVENLA